MLITPAGWALMVVGPVLVIGSIVYFTLKRASTPSNHGLNSAARRAIGLGCAIALFGLAALIVFVH